MSNIAKVEKITSNLKTSTGKQCLLLLNMENRIKLRIREKIKETERVATLVLEPLSNEFNYYPGQFLTFIFKDSNAKEFRRSYSFSSTPGVDNFPMVTVKKMPNGSASRYLVDQVQVGEILETIPAAGQFLLPQSTGKARDIFLFSGGSGITPLFSILKQVLHFEPESRATLVLANSNEQTIIFRRQIHQLAKEFPNQLKVIHFLSDTKMPFSELRELEAPVEIRIQRISNALVAQLVEQNLNFDRQHAQFFLCGPKTMMLKASQMLHYMQFEASQIHQEIFGIIEPYRPPRDVYKDSQVKIQFFGQNFLVPLKAGDTILEAAEKVGLELPYSCRSGICTTCTGRCTSGKVEMFTNAGQIDTDMSNGVVFTCVGYPLTEHVSIEIG